MPLVQAEQANAEGAEISRFVTLQRQLPYCELFDVDVSNIQGKVMFRSAAIAGISRYSRGIPRLVNVLAHKALLLAYGEGQPVVCARHVRLAALDTEDVSPKPKTLWWYGLLGATIFSASVAVAACWPAGIA